MFDEVRDKQMSKQLRARLEELLGPLPYMQVHHVSVMRLRIDPKGPVVGVRVRRMDGCDTSRRHIASAVRSLWKPELYLVDIRW